jgi:hypothetical protein
MRMEVANRHAVLTRAVRAIALVVCGSWLIVAASAWLTYRNIDYPSGSVLSKGSIVRLTPNFTLRHDAAYESNDPFSRVYTWYSRGFDLGTERYANGTCIQMGRTRPVLLGLRQDMTAQVCDTPSGRRIFVMRAFTFRYPDWARSTLAMLQS